MDIAVLEQLLDEMLSSLEELETKATAALQFLKDKGQATDKDLAPYLEQAGKTSNVRWRAARLRMMSLLSSAVKSIEQPVKTQEGSKQEKTQPAAAEQNTAPESVVEAKPSGEEVPSQPDAETGRPHDRKASEPDEARTSESKDPQIDNERNLHSAEAPASAKRAAETPQKGAA